MSRTSAKNGSIVPKVDGARARKRAISLLALVAERKETISSAFYEMGLALRELLDEKLYASLGYASFGAMLADRKVMSRSFAFRLIGVTRAFSAAEAKKLTAKKAMSLVRLAAATATDETPRELAEKGVVVDGKKVPIGELSGGAIDAQARRVRKNRAAARDDPAREYANDAVDAAEAKLRKRGVRAKLSLRPRHRELVVVVELPYEDLGKLLAVRATAT